MSSLALSDGQALLAAALDHSKTLDTQPLAVVILDGGGHPVCYARQDGCSLFRHDIARAKAMGALGMGIDTQLVSERAQKNPVFFQSLVSVCGGNIALSAGGVLIFNSEATLVGAMGISGDTADTDERCATHAIGVSGFKHRGIM